MAQIKVSGVSDQLAIILIGDVQLQQIAIRKRSGKVILKEVNHITQSHWFCVVMDNAVNRGKKIGLSVNVSF